MNAERFDKVVLDLVYGELDELTRASALRHMDQSPSARALYAELRATRELGAIPLLAPDRELREEIARGEVSARARLPLRPRVGRALSILAGYAMRPQTGMVVILLLMIGASLLFLRARPGEHDAMLVTERGVAEADSERSFGLARQEIAVPADHSTAQAHGVLRGAGAEGTDPSDEASDDAEERASDDTSADHQDEGATTSAGSDAGAGPAARSAAMYAQGMRALKEHRYAEATTTFDTVSAGGGKLADAAALHAARSVLESSGCGQALPRLAGVQRRAEGSPIAHEALWLEATCKAELGDVAAAKRAFETLVGVPEYEAKARAAAARLDNTPAKGRSATDTGAGRGAQAPSASTSEQPGPHEATSAEGEGAGASSSE